MRRFLNSFQIQLYGALLLLTALLVISLYVSNQTLVQLEALEDVEQELSGNQLANVYLLSSLARRYANATNQNDKDSLAASIRSAIATAQGIQTALIEGDAETGLPKLTEAVLQPLIADSNVEWDNYIDKIEALLSFEGSSDEEDIVAQEEMLRQIDVQSVNVYIYTDRVVNSLDFSIDEQRGFINQVVYGIGVITVISLGFAIFIVSRSVRAVAQLSNTAQEFTRGHLTTRADTQTFSEIADVGSAFNNMAQRLGSTIRELENQATEADAARLKAERSDQVKSAFLASMSHELRTPLNAIINFSKFVVRGTMGPVTERQEETLNKVVASGHHLLSLINDVLDMSKIESGTLNLFVEDDVDMRGILETVVTNSQSLLVEKPVALRTELPEALPYLRGDKKRLTQIFFNLVSNACKFTEKGSVVISAKLEGTNIVLSVKDTGPGIAAEDQAAVFEAFKQTRSGLRSGEGTGLGMPISKSLVEAHGGRLWFDSIVGEGTSFYVSLPIKSQQLVPVSS